MTGRPLNGFQLDILKRLFQVPKLTTPDIAFILQVRDRTIQRRRDEFKTTGDLRKKKAVGKNAEKLKPEYLEKLIEWLETHDEAQLDECQEFLRQEFEVDISTATISRRLKKATGKKRPHGGKRAHRAPLFEGMASTTSPTRPDGAEAVDPALSQVGYRPDQVAAGSYPQAGAPTQRMEPAPTNIQQLVHSSTPDSQGIV
ncbi:hypothetical protein QBC47DRAFT_376474 [Echria macrotheca]|uniref:Uncharacterized protein n=1 Tax=Echria macrotheca TaxID=438768 RepID=A0AAJ0FDG7_9PEZI|nr:hypothetical protein QBC47DRAFT_376474 [Echria macrotheca]